MKSYNPASVGFFMGTYFQFVNGSPKEDHKIPTASVWGLVGWISTYQCFYRQTPMKKILTPPKRVPYDRDIFFGRLLLRQCSDWKLPIFRIVPGKRIHTSPALDPRVF